MSFLLTAIVGQAMETIEFIIFPPDLNPSLHQDIFHGGAIELGELLIELAIREESLPESVDGSLLVA